MQYAEESKELFECEDEEEDTITNFKPSDKDAKNKIVLNRYLHPCILQEWNSLNKLLLLLGGKTVLCLTCDKPLVIDTFALACESCSIIFCGDCVNKVSKSPCLSKNLKGKRTSAPFQSISWDQNLHFTHPHRMKLLDPQYGKQFILPYAHPILTNSF